MFLISTFSSCVDCYYVGIFFSSYLYYYKYSFFNCFPYSYFVFSFFIIHQTATLAPCCTPLKMSNHNTNIFFYIIKGRNSMRLWELQLQKLGVYSTNAQYNIFELLFAFNLSTFTLTLKISSIIANSFKKMCLIH